MKLKKLVRLVLAVSLTFSRVACSPAEPKSDPDSSVRSRQGEIDTRSVWENADYTEDCEVGEGDKTVLFTVSAEKKR